MAMLALAAAVAQAEEHAPVRASISDCERPAAAPRDDDQIWLINTRCLGCPARDLLTESKLSIWRYTKQDGTTGAWSKSSAADFVAAQSPERRICFLLHGARTEHYEATRRGFVTHRAVTSSAPADQPMTFVTWSWPTAPAGRPLRDLRAMASRSDIESCYLAGLLARLDPQTPVSLLGFSYGARAATGAMHLLGGGTLLGRTLPSDDNSQRPLVTAILWTPAMNNDWLIPGRYHGEAVNCVDRMLVLYNPCDRAMRFYHLVAPSRKYGGMGYSGLASPGRLGNAVERVEQYNTSGQLGGEHSFVNHLNSRWIMEKTRSAVWSAR
ncbi:MAG: hypothetical protein RIC55_07785 [Pirellulaceae bacterium]